MARKVASVRRQRGIHCLIDIIKFLGLTFTATVNGRHCKLQRLPRGLGVKMRAKHPTQRTAAPTPGRFGGKAKGRSDPCIRLFPNAVVSAAPVSQLSQRCWCVT